MIEIKYRRMANAIIRLVHECDAGMKQGVVYYRNAVAEGRDGLNLLKRAARLPYRREAAIQALITTYSAATINAALALVSNLTLADLNAELTPLKIYSDTLKDHYQIDGWTLDQIATDIENNRSDIDKDEAAPLPLGYIDDF